MHLNSKVTSFRMLKVIFHECLKKIWILAVTTILFANAVSAQKIVAADKRKLEQKEDTLKGLAADIVLDSFTAPRLRSDSLFTRTLIRALQIKNSFYYPFDS